MRVLVVLAVVVCGACDFTTSCDEDPVTPECYNGRGRCDLDCREDALAEIEECEGFSDCFDDGVCDGRCVGFTDCCECLADFDCIDASADRCVSNLLNGDTIRADTECADDSSRCGGPCGRAGVGRAD